jgi:hypothetical protein
MKPIEDVKMEHEAVKIRPLFALLVVFEILFIWAIRAEAH